MCEGASGDGTLRQLVANIRRTKAVSHAHKLRLPRVVAVCYNLDPLRNCFVGKCSMLPFPGFVVKVRGRLVMTVLAMFPYGVLLEIS